MNTYMQNALVPLAPVLANHQRLVLSLRFRKALGRRMEEPPLSFYDKLFWMSTNTDTQLWSRLADKVQVRDYVAELCGSDVLTKLYALYDNADAIDFDALPDCFAIKTNNGCGSNVLIRSKADADLEAVRESLRRWLKFPYGELTGQLHYARITPQILAEELLSQEGAEDKPLVDYKFYCFNGEPKYCYIVSERHFDYKHSHSRMLYDMDWNPLPHVFVEGRSLAYIDAPLCLSQMREVASRLSKDIPFVRVDLYEVNGRVKFSELTFLPGMDPGYTNEFQRALGELISIPVEAALTC